MTILYPTLSKEPSKAELTVSITFVIQTALSKLKSAYAMLI